MSVNDMVGREMLKSWRATLFIVVEVVFVIDLSVLLHNFAVGTESWYLTLGGA